MAAEISMDFEVVTAMADNVQGAVYQLEAVDQTLRAAVARLHDSGFTGLVGYALVEDYMQTIQPQLANIVAALGELHNDLLGAVGSLRDGDLTGSQRFSGDGTSKEAGGSKKIPKGGWARPVLGGDIVAYRDGQNGWETIPLGYGFQDKLLVQDYGHTCVVYAALNLLVENGYDVSQPLGDAVVWERIASDSGKTADFLADGDIDHGFPTDNAKAVLNYFGASYQSGDFSTEFLGVKTGVDSAKAEQFLINQLKAGRPVWVTTEMDDSFGEAKGSHAETVVGVQVGKDGRLSSVLVATNFGDNKVVEIPASVFLDDWLNHRDGEYIVVKKPK